LTDRYRGYIIGEWQLVWRYPRGANELHHLTEGPDEQASLFGYNIYIDRIVSMRQNMEEWY